MGTVNSSKKAYISFLMAVFLISSMAALAYIGVFNFRNFPVMPAFVKAIAFVATFSTLFLLIFLLLNLKRRSSRTRKAAAVNQEGNREPPVRRPAGSVEVQEGNREPPVRHPAGSVEIQEGNREPPVRRPADSVEVSSDVTRHQNGLLASASTYQRYDLSPSAGIDETSRHDVIYEKNGVPYINGDLAKNNRRNLDSNFIKLVESVTGSLPSPVLRQQDKPDKAHKGGQG
jgi:hypothetical protein